MKVSEIITRAEWLTETKHDDPDWIGIINDALDDLTPSAKYLQTKSSVAVTVSGGAATYTIANDADLATAYEFLNVYYTPSGGSKVYMRNLPMADLVSKGWKLTTTQILLQGLGTEVSGTIQVDYYKKLTHVSALSDTPILYSENHELIVLYCCARAQQKDEEVEIDKTDYYNEYQTKKITMVQERTRMMEPHRRK